MSYGGPRKRIKVGFWKSNDEPLYPDVRGFVDPAWERGEREIVIRYVTDPRFRAEQYKGWSDCRICGKQNGSADYSDGRYVWPEGFGHYIREHAVKPPAEFIQHVLRRKAGEERTPSLSWQQQPWALSLNRRRK